MKPHWEYDMNGNDMQVRHYDNGLSARPEQGDDGAVVVKVFLGLTFIGLIAWGAWKLLSERDKRRAAEEVAEEGAKARALGEYSLSESKKLLTEISAATAATSALRTDVDGLKTAASDLRKDIDMVGAKTLSTAAAMDELRKQFGVHKEDVTRHQKRVDRTLREQYALADEADAKAAAEKATARANRFRRTGS